MEGALIIVSVGGCVEGVIGVQCDQWGCENDKNGKTYEMDSTEGGELKCDVDVSDVG